MADDAQRRSSGSRPIGSAGSGIGRRTLTGRALAAAGAGLLAARSARAASDPETPSPPADPPWSQQLGPGVEDRPYGQPSHYVKDVIRRNVPWLTATTESSESGNEFTRPGLMRAGEGLVLASDVGSCVRSVGGAWS